ncbi:MAG TPA: fumarylacetoacetate hydrolase family protein [Solirubrobacteraceae bacterium]|nr:fumarylacetoacetate hydrolase family protein [Solirubrobacteraceae bacterium]
MARYSVATVADAHGATAALVIDEKIHPLRGRPAVGDLLADWEASVARFEEHLIRGDLEPAGAAAKARLLAPVPRPPNLYMAGANYADHAREMRGLAADADVPKPAGGPFMFLKPTSTVVGSREPVLIGPGCERVDWEVELAAVIGRHAHRVAAEQALDHVAGYTVANDVSVRDRFIRADAAEPPMKHDWFLQKGWATSCPLGPWLVPADQAPNAHDAAMRLTVNGVLEQDSRTSQMMFSLPEQIAFLSAVVPLVPGDIICTGTCAGVGAGKGRFLAAGDVMVAEIEGIGRLENPVIQG